MRCASTQNGRGQMSGKRPITLGDDLTEAADRIEAQAKKIDALRNELCLKCGNYTLAHEGA